MAENEPNVVTRSLESLATGIRAVHDPFTYQAAIVAIIPIAVVVFLGARNFASSLARGTSDPFASLSNSIGTGVAWLVVIVIVFVLAQSWFFVAIGLRTVSRDTGRSQTSSALFLVAVGRVFAVIGALLLLLVSSIAVYLLTLLLVQLAGLTVISFIVALLTIPVMLIWFMVAVAWILGLVYMPAIAASRQEAGPVEILSRSLGVVLVYPGPAVLMVVLAGITATATYLLVGTGMVAGAALGIDPIIDEMAANQHDFSAQLAAIQTSAVLLLTLFVPYAVVSASVATFERLVGDDPTILDAPRRLVGVSWLGLRRAADTAGKAAGRLKEKLDETVSQISEAEDEMQASGPDATTAPVDPYATPTTEPSAPAQQSESKPERSHDVPAPPDGPAPSELPPGGSARSDPEAPTEGSTAVAFCAYCGADNPRGFRFCRSCGRESPS